MRRALHRLLSGTAAALVATATVALPGSPALAADPSVRLHFPDLSVAGSLPKAGQLFAWVDVPGKPGTTVLLGDLTVRVDTAGVQDIATVTVLDEFELDEDQTCTTAGTVITCTFPGPAEFEPGLELLPLIALEVTARKGAALDATGKLAFSAQLDDGPRVTSTSTVTVGEGVDLAGVISTPRTVQPGASVDAGLQVVNAGENKVKGAVLAMSGWDPSLNDGPGFRNCTYGVLIVCTFADELAAGTAYELTSPMRLKIPADAAAGSRASALGGWYTPADFDELISLVEDIDPDVLGPKGTGPAVSLQAVRPKAAARAAAGQVDTNPKNNILVSEFIVGGGVHPDLAAIGATLTGKAGDDVQARVGFVNNGPGTLYHWTFDNTDPGTLVKVPAGADVVKVDDRCFPIDFASGDVPDDIQDDLTGGSKYLCLLSEGKTTAKASALFDFTFQLNEATTGAVVINDDEFNEESLDRDSTNDSAKITVALSSGGEGGGLPVTGANAGLIGAGGAALLLAGAVGLLLVRRRRVRFTA
jgi:LPXTG-motif cell wall-anchored protein